MPIGPGQFVRAAACSIAGPAGYFLFPTVAVGAEIAKHFMGEGHPLAAAIAALVDDPTGTAAMREAGRAYVVDTHSPMRFRSLVASALRELDGD